MMRFGISVILVYLVWMPVGVQTNLADHPHMHSGFPAKLMEQTIVTSLYNVTRILSCDGGGKYKRRA